MLWYRATRPWAMDVVISFHYPSPTFSRAGFYAFLLSRETASPGVRSSLAWRDLAGPQLPHVCHAHDPPPCACASRAGSYDSFGCITGGGAPGGAPCGGMTALSSASAPCRMPFSMRSSRAATLALADAAGSSTVRLSSSMVVRYLAMRARRWSASSAVAAASLAGETGLIRLSSVAACTAASSSRYAKRRKGSSVGGSGCALVRLKACLEVSSIVCSLARLAAKSGSRCSTLAVICILSYGLLSSTRP
mmetsp:Transcript_34438/g.88076  ORF Transcript_34438/g.88076 Transcript_34438/m.88076 type:complete len:249 (-) Transcript_34438:1175-1921(-)